MQKNNYNNKKNKTKLSIVGKKRLEETGGLMPSQSRYPTRALRSITIAMKLPSVMKRWLQVSHLQPSCTYAQSERSRNPMRFRRPSRLSLQSSESKTLVFERADCFERHLQGPQRRSSGFNRTSSETELLNTWPVHDISERSRSCIFLTSWLTPVFSFLFFSSHVKDDEPVGQM